MRAKELEKRLKEAEERIKRLEERPAIWLQPYYVPQYVPQPVYPQPTTPWPPTGPVWIWDSGTTWAVTQLTNGTSTAVC